MDKDDKDEKLIGKLIKKRKEENDAFIKLLGAIENNMKPSDGKDSKRTKNKDH